MKINELNECIESMKEVYEFDETKSTIYVGDEIHRNENVVIVKTIDDNGTEVMLRRTITEETED